MPYIFFIFGYGIPKEILKDENYNLYLKSVFNQIYDVVAPEKKARPMIVFCGGQTDCFPPYQRSEAEEMRRFFKIFIRQRSFLKPITRTWQLFAEKKSISSLENLLFSRAFLQKKKIKKARLAARQAKVFIFCEQTRGRRVKILAKKIFGRNYQLQVMPMDFDVCANRYLSPDFIVKKEKSELRRALWALKSPANLKKHHQFFEKRIAYLRKAGPKAHGKAVREMWRQTLKESK